jgi:ABC-type Co2+ transport system permease subunit
MKKNWLKIMIAASAIMIAGSAAYFSVTGLSVLFNGAAIAVMVMATSLEIAKLVTATYLKQEWNNITGLNKWYLTSAVIILMVITSAGIFGYLSNAFQQQNIKLTQVDREIKVWENKINYTNQQVVTLQTQQKDLNVTQNTLITKGNVNNRLLRSVDNRDKESNQINKKINSLQDSIIAYNTQINTIKNLNIDIEKEVGGFRFVAESFGVPLNSVVKFFIILIVIVFDPLALALIIAFNGLMLSKKEPQDVNEEPISASDLISEISRIRITEGDFKKLEEILLNPPPPNEKLKESAKEYNEKILSEMVKKNQEMGLYDSTFNDDNLSQEEPTQDEENINFSTMEEKTENIFQNKEITPALSDEEVREMFMKEYENPGYIEEEYPGQLDELDKESVPEPFVTEEEITNAPITSMEKPIVETSQEDEKKK